MRTIYQSFGGVEMYPSIEEKAANLLYFVVKNHSFSDGNKRIAAFLFVYFLDRNRCLYHADGTRRLGDARHRRAHAPGQPPQDGQPERADRLQRLHPVRRDDAGQHRDHLRPAGPCGYGLAVSRSRGRVVRIGTLEELFDLPAAPGY